MTAVDHDHAARLVTHLSQQRSSGKYCDVCVCVAEQRFLAHKCVLSANSDQLDALILDATDEDNASHDIEIEIHGVSPVGFEIVLEYFYTGVLRLEPSTVTHTWMTAVYLGLPDIISRCNSYCQQSVSLTAQAKATTVPSLLALPAAQAQDTSATGSAPLAQLSTSTILSSASNQQPKVNSTVKTKTQNLVQPNNDLGKDGKPQPFEIRENRATISNTNAKTDNSESAAKKAKLLTMDESAIAWNYGQQNSSSSQTAQTVSLPATSAPQVVVNLVQGYGAYQPVDINTWTGSGAPQQWAQVQVGKGQLVTAGVIPIAPQGKSIQSQATAPVVALPSNDSQNSIETAHADENSQKSYATLSLVSQDSQQSESKNEGDTTSADIATPVPATPAPSESNHTIQTPLLAAATPARSQAVLAAAPELNLDSIQFTQISTEDGQRPADATTSTAVTFVQPIAMINNLQFAGDGTKCETMLMQTEVEQLRIQHQQLQRLRLESGENGSDPPLQGESVKAVLATSKRKRKAPTRVSKSEDGTGDTHELHAHSNVRKSKSLAESVLVTITPEHMEYLYQKYPDIKKEPPVSGTCDVMQLLQHGKARQRKSSEQNALNNTIRTILDTTGIVESGDARVQDAVCFIMDRFTVLQDHMNDAYVRKQLTIKVKHSIHCKKWRLKRHKMKQMMSTSSPDTPGWIVDSNTSNISVSSDNSLMNEESFPDMGKSVASNSSLIVEDNLRKGISPSNSLLNDESLHG